MKKYLFSYICLAKINAFERYFAYPGLLLVYLTFLTLKNDDKDWGVYLMPHIKPKIFTLLKPNLRGVSRIFLTPTLIEYTQILLFEILSCKIEIKSA